MDIKTLAVALLTVTFAACGGDGGNDSSQSQPIDTTKTIKHGGTGSTATINETKTFNADLSGFDNYFIFEKNQKIKTLTIIAQSTDIWLKEGTTNESATIEGNSNIFCIDGANLKNVTIMGNNNQLYKQNGGTININKSTGTGNEIYDTCP